MPSLGMQVSDNNLVTILTFSQAWIDVIGNSMHAIVIFLFNSMVREEFLVMIGKKKQVSNFSVKVTAIKVQPVTATAIKLQPVTVTALPRRQAVH
uniref:Uncharacterized protein n=1 Tax=Acrobeloides nanus TaxID=290746 RepID=A0A914EEH7_9BILA